MQLDHQTVLKILPDRDINAHKGSFGKILLLCGSVGYTGAAALAALGALRSGAGLVYLGVPESIYAIEAIKLTEPVVFPVPEEDGMFSCDACSLVRQRLCEMDAVLIGPGIGRSGGAEKLLKLVLEEFAGPVVVDADGIFLLKKHMDILRERTFPTILTPHEGEFVRLTDSPIRSRKEDAVRFAKMNGGILVLKGHNTVITDGIRTYINPTGNPGMAVGGSGDVLAGMIVSLLGQGLDPLQAAACGVWLHGAAGDLCARELGQYGMLPSDMLNVLPRLMK